MTPPTREDRPKKKLLVVTVVVLFVVALVVTAGLLVRADQQRKQELRDEVVADFETSQVDFDNSREALQVSLDAASEVVQTERGALNDGSFLDQLVTAQSNAQETADRAALLDAPDVERASNEDLIAAGEEMAGLVTDLDAAEKSLTSRADSVTRDVATKKAADDAEAARLAQEARLAEEAAALVEQKGQAGPITYEELFRGGDGLAGNFYTFEGEVIQDAGLEGELSLYRVNMTRDPGYSRVFWTDTILIAVSGEPSQRILEDDLISFIGVSAGITSYETVLGATVEIPLLAVDGGDVTFTGRSE